MAPPEFDGPISTGPPTPPWIRLTRRRISAHDALAEIGFGDQQRAQFFRRNQQRLDIAFGVAVDQRDAARKLTDLGEKLSGPLVDDGGDVTEAVALGDRHMAGQHHEHSRAGLAGLEQRFTALVMAHVAEPAHAPDLLRRQGGKGLLEAGKRACQQRAAVGLISCRGGHSHLRLASQEGSKTCRGPNPGYSPGFSPPLSCGAMASLWEGAGAMSLRPRACNFRRLRFSRNASFSRSRLASFFAG
jgi:hypothetical protein